MIHDNNGSILRTHRNKNYKNISCTAIDDKELSFRAKGIHTYLITRPDNWKFNKTQIQEMSSEGRDAFHTAMEELKNRGYLRITPRKNTEGNFTGYYWDISEEPSLGNTGLLDIGTMDFQESVEPVVERTRRKYNKKEKNKKDNKSDNEKQIRIRGNPKKAPSLPMRISETMAVGHDFPYEKSSVANSFIWYWAVKRLEKHKIDFVMNAALAQMYNIKHSQNIPEHIGNSFEEQKMYIDWFLNQRDDFTAKKTQWAFDYMVHISSVNKYIANKSTAKVNKLLITDEDRENYFKENKGWSTFKPQPRVEQPVEQPDIDEKMF